MLVCSECGSKNVEITAWVNANTNEYISDYTDEDTWCQNCSSACNLIDEEEYLKEKKN